MRGLEIRAGSVCFRDDLPDAARAGEVPVRVRLAGICATDLALQRGYMGFAGVPGHEFVGEALAGPFAGQRVVGEINAGCGVCAACTSGLERHCPARTVLGILGRSGAHASELSLPARSLHPVPDAVRDEEAVFVEPLAAAFEIAEQVRLVPGQRALVAGDGKLGILCAWVLDRHGLEVTVAGHHPARQELLPERATHRPDLLERGPSAVPPYDLAVEATGRATTLPVLLPFVRPRGTVVLKTTCELPTPLDLAGVVVPELTLVGSRCGRFEPALAALAAHEVPDARLVAARFPLREGATAYARAAQRGTLKVLLG